MKQAGGRGLDAAPRSRSPLHRLDPLVGRWRLSGRTLHSNRDDIRGKVEIEWLPGGHLLELRSEIHVGKFSVHSLELVTFDPVSRTFPSFVYTGVDKAPLPYRWQLRGDRVVHSGLGATFRGTWSNRGKILSGEWRADPGVPQTAQNSYTAKMTRVE
jgi:hypothetical protein